jgi:hypothetical protein
MPTYYAYGEHNPQVIQDPNTGHWESVDDWPRTYKYLPAYDSYQGFHPPAPVYQGHAQVPAQAPTMYYNYHNVRTLSVRDLKLHSRHSLFTPLTLVVR